LASSLPNAADILTALKINGIQQFGVILDPIAASKLYHHALEQRDFGPHMFLTEAEYIANPQHFGVNPKPGFNYLESFEGELGFLEHNPYLTSVLENLLGKGYEVHNKKFVCGIPDSWIPEWLLKKMEEASINNLGAYMRPEYRDITYFHGIDFHQDIIDWPSWPAHKKTHEFITLYVYIHDVTEQDAPLVVLPGTHKFGTSSFPHNLCAMDNGYWRYTDNNERSIQSMPLMLTGGAGYAALWHSCMLHGTQSISKAKNMRLSLRYILSRSKTAAHVGLDEVNDIVDGPLYLGDTRKDLDKEGKVVLKKNNISTLDTE
jgi:hypothetical protein